MDIDAGLAGLEGKRGLRPRWCLCACITIFISVVHIMRREPRVQQLLAPMAPGDGRASVCDVCNVSAFARALDWQKTEGAWRVEVVVAVADADQTGLQAARLS